jgi:PAS domain S-box-containing protein
MEPDQELSFSSRRLAAIVESSDDAIVSKDLDGTIVTWNPAAERMFGYSAQEAVGRSIRLIIPADRQQEEDLVLERIRAGQTVAHFETTRVRKDGTELPISLTVSPVRDPSGKVIGASKIARDISDRVRSATALAAVEAARADLQRRLLTLVSASGSLLGAPTLDQVLPAILGVARQLVSADGYAVWQLHPSSDTWRIESSHGLSDEFCDNAVPSVSEVRERELLKGPLLIPDVKSDSRIRNRRRALEAEGIRSMLAVALNLHATRSGTLVFYGRTPLKFDEVDVQAATALANIASGAMSSAALYEAQRRGRLESDFLADSGKALSGSLDYHQTLNHVATLAVPFFADWCAVDLMDAAGTVRPVALAHVDPAKLALAQRFIDRFPEDDTSPFSVSHVLRTGQAVVLERMPADDVVAASARSEEHLAAVRELGITSFMRVPVCARESMFGVITFVSAESGRHYTSNDLRLAQEIADRAALAIDNAQAYAEVEGANRMKDEFLATLSHELRTPLNALLGYARMLKWNMVPAEHHARAFEVIERNGTALARLVEDILDISRVVSGKVRLRLQATELVHLVGQSLETVAAAALAKGVTIQTELPATLPLATVDPDRLQQALWNLLANAVKFTPAGGRVDVSVSCTGDHFDIVVRDTGIGISPEFLPRVFERFRQADSRYAREHGGLGLGLAIARHLIEMHGGTLTAQSAGLGHGATFSVRLPAQGPASTVTEAQGTARVPSTPSEPVAIRLEGLRVLAVDDDADESAMIQEVLEAAGARVITANSGAAALDLLERETVDVLLADLGMPGMDGFELIREVRRRGGANGDIPATAITAYTRSDDRERALASGFDRHVAKPVDPADLISALQRLSRR